MRVCADGGLLHTTLSLKLILCGASQSDIQESFFLQVCCHNPVRNALYGRKHVDVETMYVCWTSHSKSISLSTRNFLPLSHWAVYIEHIRHCSNRSFMGSQWDMGDLNVHVEHWGWREAGSGAILVGFVDFNHSNLTNLHAHQSLAAKHCSDLLTKACFIKLEFKTFQKYKICPTDFWGKCL